MSASILIVDDEVSILNSLSSILEDEGYDVSVAKSGMEALKHCAMNPPELMMLDIWMPEMDGLETARRIRLLPGGGATMIVALTANAFAEVRAHCLAEGLDDFLAKPYQPDGLFETVLRCLSRRPRATGVTA